MKRILDFFKKHSTAAYIGGAVILVLAFVIGRSLHKPASQTTSEQAPLVELLKAADYAQGSRTISANGVVESLQQADLKSQATGKVTRINVKVGQQVSQGQVLATLEQNSQLAALTSARGALELAQASYNRVISGASNEDINLAQVALDTAQANLENTKKQQDTSVSNAYKTLLNSGLAAIAGNGNTDGATVTISGSYNSSEQGQYKITVYAAGDGLRFKSSGLENAEGLIQSTSQPLGTRGLFIQFSSTSVSTADVWTINIPNTQGAGYVANNNAYQAAKEGQTAALSAAQNAVSQAQAALDLKKSQARPADVQAAQAQILTAQGQVQAAQAALENTIIRAPFSGVVSAVNIKYSDLVSAGSSVISVVSPGGLQVKIFVGDIDLKNVHVGDSASVGKNAAAGTVTNVAPNVSAGSKTGEVDVAINDPSGSGLTSGQNVTVNILGKAGQTATTTPQTLLLPLQAVKLTPDGKAYIYSLNSNETAAEHEVAIGRVDGENVEVTSGFEIDWQILSNAYGVGAGQKVQLQK